MFKTVSTSTLIAVLLLSAAALAYELLLVRMFSIIHWHHFAFMVISIALLGYGVSGSLITLLRHWMMARYNTLLVVNALLFSITSVGCFMVVQQLPFNALEILWDQQQWWRLFYSYLLLSLPFFFVSTAIALTMMVYPAQLSRIYGIDLLGAGLGALLFMLLLQLLSHELLLRLIAITGLVAASLCALLFTRAPRRLMMSVSVLLMVLVMVLPDHWLELKLTEFKGLQQSLQVRGALRIDRFSDAMSRVDVIRSDEIPVRFAPGMSINNPETLPPQLLVFRDGDEMSTIDHNFHPRALQYQHYLTSALPYHVKQAPDTILLLGSATGGELPLAAAHAKQHVDAVEEDGKLNQLISQRYAGYFNWQSLNQHVSLHNMSARSFIASTQDKYDLIILAVPGASSGAAAGVNTLSTSYDKTAEAISAYFDHLEADGVLSITLWTSTPAKDNLRLFATVVDVLQQRVSKPGDHITWIRSWNTATLLIKKNPLSTTEITAIKQFSTLRSYDIAWLPQLDIDRVNRYSILQQPIYHLAATAMLGGRAEAFINNYKYDITPINDDRPYFNNTFKWPLLKELVGKSGAGGMALIDTGYPTLLLTLLQALIAAVILILLPLLLVKRKQENEAGFHRLRLFFYFSSIGLAFIFIEMAFIQKFSLILGQPLYAVATAISVFLLFSAAGSLYVQHRLQQTPEIEVKKLLTLIIIMICLITALYLFVLPLITDSIMALSIASRIVLVSILVAPLAFYMGMPLPLGLLTTQRFSPQWLPWAWGINGCASVISSILAILLAIEIGFSGVMICAGILYLGSWLVFKEA